MQLIASTNLGAAELILYFESTYIGIQRGRGERRRRGEFIFPIKLRNVRDRILHDLPRINNAVEGFHCG